MDSAVYRGDLERVKELIDLDVKLVDGCNSSRDAPLIEAAKYGHREIFDLLIRCGAEVNCKAGNDAWTPLHFACVRDWENQARLILEKGADPNAAASNGKTPLHFASRKGWVYLVRLMLEKGADPNVAADDGATPLVFAAQNRHREVFDLLIQCGAEINCGRGYNNWSPLHWACSRGWVDEVRFILEKGADPNAAGKYDGDLPLEVTAREGHKDIFVLLFQYGATMEFDCARISKDSFLEAVFTDVKLCTQSIVNKFHCHSLPALYRNPDIAKMLPVLKNFKLKDEQTQQIAKYVELEVETKKLCNVFNSQPIVLMLLCVKSLLSHHS